MKIDSKIINKFNNNTKSIYRFYKTNQNNLDALRNKYIWLSQPSSYKDSHDSPILFEFENQEYKIQKVFIKYLPLLLISKNIVNFNSIIHLPEIQKEYKSILNTKELIDLGDINGILEKYKIPHNIITLFMEKLEAEFKNEEMYNKFYSDFKKTIENAKNYYFTCCFTEKYINEKLWEEYAHNYEGFCIEYEVSVNLFNNYDLSTPFFRQIVYRNPKKIDFSRMVELTLRKEIGENVEDEIYEMDRELINQLRHKKESYMYEQETRLYIVNTPVVSQAYKFDNAKKIFLGYKMKNYNKTRLIKIANYLGLEIYQQHFCFLRNELYYEKIG